jgi:hypothetical protein
MEYSTLSEAISELSFKSIFNLDIEILIPLLYLIISIAIYLIIIWHFYRFIAKRDSFTIEYSHHPFIVSKLKYFLIFPVCAFLFFIGFSLMLLFLTKNIEIGSILSTSFVIVVAIRIVAYYNEDLSRDVAKMLPFALLGIFLIDPFYFGFEAIMVKINSLPNFFLLCSQFIILIIGVEWSLRFFLSISHFIKAHRSKQNNKQSPVKKSYEHPYSVAHH